MSAEVEPSARSNFYAKKVMSAAEASELEEARSVEGLEEEIALLRVRLRRAANEKDDYTLVLKGAGLLVRAVAAQYRLSPRSSRDLSENLAAVLNRFGDLIVPADR